MTGDDRSTKISGGEIGVVSTGDNATIHVDTIRFGPESPPPAVDLPPPVNDRARAVFVGRGDEMDRLAESLLPAEPTAVAITAIEGMAGVGKSYLADHFALVHEDRFGGYLVLPIDPLSPQTTESLIATLADRLKVPARMDQVRAAIRSSRALVHVENVDSPEAARTAGALMAQLKGCALVLTGRMEGIGRGFGRIIALRPFSVEEGLRQLSEELAFLESGLISDGESRRLVETLAGLPLAIHLAAGYLAAGYTPAEFLENLEATRLALEPENPAETGLSRDPQRLILASAFDLSLDVLDRRIPEGGPAFPALGLLPAAGFGISLGAAAMGLDPKPSRRVLDAARKLSLVERLRTDADGPLRWRVHPLLAAHLRGRADEDAAGERVTDWFMTRLPKPTDDDYTTWRELNAEHPALAQWLRRMPPEQAESVVVHTWYGYQNGPWAAWAAFCEDLLESDPPPEVKSKALWLLGQSRVSLGQGDEALAAAEQKAEVERNRGADRGLALARGLAADILQARGDLDEALRIRREEELPVYEQLGDVRSRAVTMGYIADIFQARGDLDEALRIRREEELPVYERLGDVRSRAVTVGQIADIFQARGDLDEALRIRREEQLPVYERLGDVRERAVTMGYIADIFQARGDLDEALRIRREGELPVYERLGDVRSRAVTVGKIADILAARGDLDEALRIRREEQLPVYERLGDVRERAVAMGKIADIFQARGDLDEALRIRREEQLPVYEQLGDVRGLLIARAKIGMTYLQLNPPRRDEANTLLCQALADARRMNIPEANQIRMILMSNGMSCEDDDGPSPDDLLAMLKGLVGGSD